MTVEIIVGSGIVFFVVLYRILKHELKEQQGALIHFECVCGKPIFFNHSSTIACQRCKAEYDVEVEKSKVVSKLKLLPGDKLYSCIDCHKKIIIRGDDKIVMCPNCKRGYYVKNEYIKPMNKRKWWSDKKSQLRKSQNERDKTLGQM